ncbi:MAG TPA: hypothetical protein VEK38_02940, partial [Candidatus Bathyarchaeia archaeon]|nr:hypothetical protein [Candidatus Bathyarchaeia archaeon]
DIISELSGTIVQKRNKEPEKRDMQKDEHDQKMHHDNGISSLTDTILMHCVRPCSWDDLLETTQVDLPSLQALLLQLQIAGKVQQDMSGKWVSV